MMPRQPRLPRLDAPVFMPVNKHYIWGTKVSVAGHLYKYQEEDIAVRYYTDRRKGSISAISFWNLSTQDESLRFGMSTAQVPISDFIFFSS